VTRDEWTTLHRAARERRRADLDKVGRFWLMRDHNAALGVTKRHDKGHMIAPAAIVNVLGYAAASRHRPTDHAIYIDRVRRLRRFGTWP
jgi:hypothetical protein